MMIGTQLSLKINTIKYTVYSTKLFETSLLV